MQILCTICTLVEKMLKVHDLLLKALSLSLTVGAVSSTLVTSTDAIKSSITLLYQNNLDWTDDINHHSFLLLESELSFPDAERACQALGEQLLSSADVKSQQNDLLPQLQYVSFRGDFPSGQSFWLSDGAVSAQSGTLKITSPLKASRLPTLCTQSSNGATNAASIVTAGNQISTTSTSSGNTFTGYRNQKSFRFLGIPYSNNPARFEYSSVSTQTHTQINSTIFGPQCFQVGTANYSEDCLFLNIFSPHLPTAEQEPKKLRPVLFWIHGGAFTSGTGADGTVDGGNMASRGDVVVVTINYRLSTIGFLAIPGTDIKGNFGLADQITALEWVKNNIEGVFIILPPIVLNVKPLSLIAFGGDPTRVTIAGQSAGAGSVRALLGSPKARGLFSAAVPASNLAGYEYATTYSLYYTPEQEYSVAAQQIINTTGCTSSSTSDEINCLKNVPAATLVNLATVARYVIVDGTFIVADQIDVTKPGASAHVPVLWGSMADDGAAFIGYPTLTTDRNEAIQTVLAGYSDIATVVNNATELFPISTSTTNATLNLFNLTSRIATDSQFRCLDQATVHSAIRNSVFPTAYYYQFDRSYQPHGYDPNAPVCDAPITATHPLGDPSLPYFKCHSGDLYFEFGTFGQFSFEYRDDLDLPFSQLVLDYWTSFVRSHDPNPSLEFLSIRGHESTIEAIAASGHWDPVTSKKDTLRRLNYPPEQSDFLESDQCTLLGLPIDYYDTQPSVS